MLRCRPIKLLELWTLPYYDNVVLCSIKYPGLIFMLMLMKEDVPWWCLSYFTKNQVFYWLDEKALELLDLHKYILVNNNMWHAFTFHGWKGASVSVDITSKVEFLLNWFKILNESTFDVSNFMLTCRQDLEFSRYVLANNVSIHAL